MKSQSALGLSHALAFWDKHRYAMDEIYELYEPDGGENPPDDDTVPELLELWRGDQRASLVQVFEQAEADRDRLLGAAYSELDAAFGGSSSPLRIARRKFRDPWVVGATATPARKKLPQGAISLSIWLDSVGVGNYYVFVTIWTKGGRRAARTFSQTLADVHEASHFPAEDWMNGVAFLSRIPLSLHTDARKSAVDLDAVIAALRVDLSKQSSERWQVLIDRLREQG